MVAIIYLSVLLLIAYCMFPTNCFFMFICFVSHVLHCNPCLLVIFKSRGMKCWLKALRAWGDLQLHGLLPHRRLWFLTGLWFQWHYFRSFLADWSPYPETLPFSPWKLKAWLSTFWDLNKQGSQLRACLFFYQPGFGTFPSPWIMPRISQSKGTSFISPGVGGEGYQFKSWMLMNRSSVSPPYLASLPSPSHPEVIGALTILHPLCSWADHWPLRIQSLHYSILSSFS